MNQAEITIKEAIRVGKFYILYGFWIVVFVCFFGGIIVPIGLFGEDSGKAVMLMAIMWLIPFVYFYFASRFWQLWAFKKVRDVHTLRTIARQKKLILIGEIKYESNKDEVISKKFAGKDIFIDDTNVPKEFIMKASKFREYVVLVISFALVVGFGIYGLVSLFLNNDFQTAWQSLLVVSIFLALFRRQYRLLFIDNKNGKIEIFINQKGIQLSSSGISYYWDNIKNENVFLRARSRYNVFCFLTFDYLGKTVKTDITHWMKDVNRMKYLLEIYRGRFERDNLATLKETKFLNEKGSAPIAHYKKARSTFVNLRIIIGFMIVFLIILVFSVIMADTFNLMS